MISYSEDKTIRIWNKEEKCLKYVLEGHKLYINDIKITYDKKFIISGSSDCTIRIWSLPDCNFHGVLKGHASPVLIVCVGKNSNILVSGDEDGRVVVWDYMRKEKLKEFRKHNKAVTFLEIFECSSFVVSISRYDTLKFWNFTNDVEYLNMPWRYSSSSVALTTNSKYLIVANSIPEFYIWRLPFTK